MTRVVGDGELVPETDDAFQTFVKEPGRVHYVAMAIRPGIADCLRVLELRHYAPRTPRNDLFHLRFFDWSDLSWFIVSIPVNERHFMKTAAAHGLRIATGIPTVISSNKIKQFPITGLNVFVLENTKGHPIYKR